MATQLLLTGEDEPQPAEKEKPCLRNCGTCRHGGVPFKIAGKTNLTCEHPEEAIAGEGLDAFRMWFDAPCKAWEAKGTEVPA